MDKFVPIVKQKWTLHKLHTTTPALKHFLFFLEVNRTISYPNSSSRCYMITSLPFSLLFLTPDTNELHHSPPKPHSSTPRDLESFKPRLCLSHGPAHGWHAKKDSCLCRLKRTKRSTQRMHEVILDAYTFVELTDDLHRPLSLKCTSFVDISVLGVVQPLRRDSGLGTHGTI